MQLNGCCLYAWPSKLDLAEQECCWSASATKSSKGLRVAIHWPAPNCLNFSCMAASASLQPKDFLSPKKLRVSFSFAPLPAIIFLPLQVKKESPAGLYKTNTKSSNKGGRILLNCARQHRSEFIQHIWADLHCTLLPSQSQSYSAEFIPRLVPSYRSPGTGSSKMEFGKCLSNTFRATVSSTRPRSCGAISLSGQPAYAAAVAEILPKLPAAFKEDQGKMLTYRWDDFEKTAQLRSLKHRLTDKSNILKADSFRAGWQSWAKLGLQQEDPTSSTRMPFHTCLLFLRY